METNRVFTLSAWDQWEFQVAIMWGCRTMIGKFRFAGSALLLASAFAAAPAMAANLDFETGDLTGWTTAIFNGSVVETDVSLFGGAAGVIGTLGNFGAPVVNSTPGGHDGYPIPEGVFSGYVQAGDSNVEIQIRQTLFLQAGSVISGWFGFRGNDFFSYSSPGDAEYYNDYGFLTIGGSLVDLDGLVAGSTYFDVATVGDNGDTGDWYANQGGDLNGWLHFTWTAPTTDSFVIALGVANVYLSDPSGPDPFPEAASAAFLDAQLTPPPPPPVPEPATWAMMIGGLFGAGAMLRRRARVRFA
jgi:hypothetical protein